MIGALYIANYVSRHYEFDGVGATDQDLPALFAALDPQIDRLAARFGVELVDVSVDVAPDLLEAARAVLADVYQGVLGGVEVRNPVTGGASLAALRDAVERNG